MKNSYTVDYYKWKSELVKCAARKSEHEEVTQLELFTFSSMLLNYTFKVEETFSLLMKRGELCVEVDGKIYKQVKTGSLIVFPGQWLNIVSASSDFEGIACIVSIDFLNYFEMNNVVQTYFSVLRKPCQAVNEICMERIASYFYQIFHLMNLYENPYRKEASKNLLKACFYEVSFFFQEKKKAKCAAKDMQVFEEFLRMLQNEPLKNCTLDFCAKSSGMTTRRFNPNRSLGFLCVVRQREIL